MGCSTSSQTLAVDSSKPGVKPEESNGTSTTANAATANGDAAEDGDSVPDQTPSPPPPGEAPDVKAAGEAPKATAPPPAQEEELQLLDADAELPEEADAAAETAPPENAQEEDADSTEPEQEKTGAAPTSSE